MRVFKSSQEHQGGTFRVKKSTRQNLRNGKRRIARRLKNTKRKSRRGPVFTTGKLTYEIAARSSGIAVGGIGAIHCLAHKSGLVKEIDSRLNLLKIHNPYCESDHVLNIAYNILAGGTCLEDLELLRNNENYLDALGAASIPDPTTAGDFCRRFEAIDVEILEDAVNESRLRIWRDQPESFFEEAIIDADGTIAPTTGECKQGMDMSYKGEWGYHPLVLSLANTNEVLSLRNRSGNRPSQEGAATQYEVAIDLTRRAGFKKITLRGDSAFSQTEHLDRWHVDGVEFVFGYNATANLVQLADDLPQRAWKTLERKKRQVKTRRRTRPLNVKEAIVKAREYENIRLLGEEHAEFSYQPSQCDETYRMVVVKKDLSHEKGQALLFESIKYFFYITNKKDLSSDEVIFFANDRCNQEKLIDQLKNGVHSMRMPLDSLVSNEAYMAMASLAWTLKAWFALILPETGRWAGKHQAEKYKVLGMSFKSFMNGFIRMPAQIVRSGRQIIFRLLDWNPLRHIFFRAVDAIDQRMLC